MYLEDELPDILTGLVHLKNRDNAYQSVHLLRDYTFSQIRENNFSKVKKCFALAEKLFLKGNTIVKGAIENVFVYSFSDIPVCTSANRKLVMGMIPGTLYSLYIGQVMHHGS